MWKSFRGRVSGGHLRPLEWLQVAACWLQMAAGDKRLLAATCGHLRPLEWLQVAAISKIKLRASCVLNGISIRFLWCFYGISLGFLWFLWHSYGSSMMFLWYFHGITMGCLKEFYGILLGFPSPGRERWEPKASQTTQNELKDSFIQSVDTTSLDSSCHTHFAMHAGFASMI